LLILAYWHLLILADASNPGSKRIRQDQQIPASISKDQEGSAKTSKEAITDW